MLKPKIMCLSYAHLHCVTMREYIAALFVHAFVSLLVREEVLLADLSERKILFRLEIYDRLR